jgi:hypothetical protein
MVETWNKIPRDLRFELLYEFARDEHPNTFRRWLKDLVLERLGLLRTQEGWTKGKEKLLIKYRRYVLQIVKGY